MPKTGVASDPKWVTIRAKILGRTPMAIRARIERQMVWLPRSTIEDHGEEADDALAGPDFMPVIDLSVAAWKAREYGWV
jgi:hypothetical protein